MAPPSSSMYVGQHALLSNFIFKTSHLFPGQLACFLPLKPATVKRNVEEFQHSHFRFSPYYISFISLSFMQFLSAQRPLVFIPIEEENQRIQIFCLLLCLLIFLLSCCRVQNQHLFLVAEDIWYLSQASRAGNQIGGDFVTGLGRRKRSLIASPQKLRMTNRNKFQLVFHTVQELQQLAAKDVSLKR